MPIKELEFAADKMLIDQLPGGVKNAIDALLAKGVSDEQVLEFVRRKAGGSHKLVAMSVWAYLRSKGGCQMRVCPFEGCGTRIGDKLFACNPHWRTLSKDQQNVIYRAYRAYLGGGITVDELRATQKEVLDQVQGIVRG